MWITLCLCGATAFANIDLRQEAVRMERFAPKLAELTGKKIAIAPEIRDEVLVVRVKDVPTSVLLTKVAEACAAEWSKQKDGTLLLIRPSEMEEKQKAEWVDQKLAEIKTSTEEYRKRVLPSSDPWTEQDIASLLGALKEFDPSKPITDMGRFETHIALHQRLFGGRLLARLIGEIDLRRIATALPSERVVFSSKPTNAQLSLGPSLRSALDQFVKEQADFAKVAGKMDKLPIALSETGGVASYYTEPLKEPPAEAQLIVSSRGARWDLTIFDRNGLPAFVVVHTDMSARKPIPVVIDPTMLSISKDQITLDTEAADFVSATQGSMKDMTLTLRPATGSLLDKLEHPEEFDPLAFAATSCIFQIADAANANFVGSVPDSMVFGRKQIGQVASAMGLRLADGWLIGRPSNFADRLRHMPRTPLGEFARLVARDGARSLEASFCLGRAKVDLSPSNYGPSSSAMIHEGYERSLGSPWNSGGADPIACLILGSLKKPQIAALEEGKQLLFRELPTDAKKAVSSLFARQDGLRLGLRSGPDDLNGFRNAWTSEPTQAWGAAVPEDSVLSLLTNARSSFVDLDAPTRCSLTAVDIAHELAAPSKPSFSHYTADHRLLAGESSQYMLSLNFGRLHWGGTVNGMRVLPRAPARKLADFPQELRDEIEEYRKRFAGN